LVILPDLPIFEGGADASGSRKTRQNVVDGAMATCFCDVSRMPNATIPTKGRGTAHNETGAAK
jgi:hypothetical protein